MKLNEGDNNKKMFYILIIVPLFLPSILFLLYISKILHEVFIADLIETILSTAKSIFSQLIIISGQLYHLPLILIFAGWIYLFYYFGRKIKYEFDTSTIFSSFYFGVVYLIRLIWVVSLFVIELHLLVLHGLIQFLESKRVNSEKYIRQFWKEFREHYDPTTASLEKVHDND